MTVVGSCPKTAMLALERMVTGVIRDKRSRIQDRRRSSHVMPSSCQTRRTRVHSHVRVIASRVRVPDEILSTESMPLRCLMYASLPKHGVNIKYHLSIYFQIW